MKKTILFLVLLLSVSGFSQSVNDFQYVFVPTKFTEFSEANQYNLNTITKIMLQKYGFKSYVANDSVPDEIINNSCKKLYADLIKGTSPFKSELKVVLKDCKEKVVYETNFGVSKEKDLRKAYYEALLDAFKSFDSLKYKYNGKNDMQPTAPADEIKVAVISAETINNQDFFFVQPIANGFQVVNSELKEIMKLYNTSDKNIFIGFKENIQGVVFSKNNQWFFEYYVNGKLVSEVLKLKF